MNKDKILEIVTDQVRALVDSLPPEQKFEVSTDTKLYGANSNLDSLSLVSLIVDLETVFSADYGLDISLSDDKAMSRKVSPFDSIQNMVDFIEEQVSGNQ